MEHSKQTDSFENSGERWPVGIEVEVCTQFFDGEQWQSAGDDWRGIVMVNPHAMPERETVNVMPHEPRGTGGYLNIYPRLLSTEVVKVELPSGVFVELRMAISPSEI